MSVEREPTLSPHIAKIIEVTRDLIDAYGDIDSITTRQVAKIAGVSPQTLYNRFGSKMDLITFVIQDHYIREVDVGFKQEGNQDQPVDAILNGISMLNETLRKYPNFSKTVSLIYFSAGKSLEIHENMSESLLSAFSPLIEKMVQKKELQPNTPIHELANLICEQVFLVTYQWALGFIKSEEVQDRMYFSALSILSGHAKPKSCIKQHLQQVMERMKATHSSEDTSPF